MKAPAKYMNVNVNACGSVAYILTIVISLQDKESMMQVLRTVDKANGYCFGDLEERNLQVMMSAAVGADFQFSTYPYHTVWFSVFVKVMFHYFMQSQSWKIVLNYLFQNSWCTGEICGGRWKNCGGWSHGFVTPFFILIKKEKVKKKKK